MNDLLERIDSILERNGIPTNGTEDDILRAMGEALRDQHEASDEASDLADRLASEERLSSDLERKLEKAEERIEELETANEELLDEIEALKAADQ